MLSRTGLNVCVCAKSTPVFLSCLGFGDRRQDVCYLCFGPSRLPYLIRRRNSSSALLIRQWLLSLAAVHSLAFWLHRLSIMLWNVFSTQSCLSTLMVWLFKGMRDVLLCVGTGHKHPLLTLPQLALQLDLLSTVGTQLGLEERMMDKVCTLVCLSVLCTHCPSAPWSVCRVHALPTSLSCAPLSFLMVEPCAFFAYSFPGQQVPCFETHRAEDLSICSPPAPYTPHEISSITLSETPSVCG